MTSTSRLVHVLAQNIKPRFDVQNDLSRVVQPLTFRSPGVIHDRDFFFFLSEPYNVYVGLEIPSEVNMWQ